MKIVKDREAATAATGLRVAYHAGPPQIHFAGRVWHQGDEQPVTEAEWSAMQARADFGHFDFRVAGPKAPAPSNAEE